MKENTLNSSPDLPHVSRIFQQSGDLYKQRLWTLVGINLVPQVVSLLFTAYLSASADNMPGTPLIIGLIEFVIIFISQGALLFALVEQTTVLEAYQKAWKKAVQIIGVDLLYGLLVTAGFFLLIVPGIYLLIKYIFAPIAVIAEDQKGMQALSASSAYVKGKWWYVFGIYITITILSYGVDYVVDHFPQIFPWSSDLLGALVSLFTVPFFTVTTYILYTYCRSAKK